MQIGKKTNEKKNLNEQKRKFSQKLIQWVKRWTEKKKRCKK